MCMIVCTTLFFSGCGTIVNLVGPADSKPPPRSVFGGVRLNLVDMKNHDYPIVGVVNVIDLPFSCVLDIVVLPVTIIASLTRSEPESSGELNTKTFVAPHEKTQPHPRPLKSPKRKWWNPFD